MTNIYKPIISELSDYKGWHNREEVDFVRYATTKLTPDLAITVIRLFWPSFILHENAVFLAFQFDEANYIDWKDQLQGDSVAIEKVMNHIHLAQDLLIYPFENLGYDNIAYFGSTLVKTWKCALAEAFPDRRFQVSGEKDGDFDDFVITFWQQS